MSASPANALRLLILLAACCLVGCQTTRGAWYFQREPGGSLIPRECDPHTRACLYLSVLNDTRRSLPVQEIRVYSSPPSKIPLASRGLELWSCESNAASAKFELEPAQLVVVALPHTGAASCRIPMHAELLDGQGTRLAGVTIDSNQPDSIPGSWLACHRVNHMPSEEAQFTPDCDRQQPSEDFADGLEAKCLPMPFACRISHELKSR